MHSDKRPWTAAAFRLRHADRRGGFLAHGQDRRIQRADICNRRDDVRHRKRLRLRNKSRGAAVPEKRTAAFRQAPDPARNALDLRALPDFGRAVRREYGSSSQEDMRSFREHYRGEAVQTVRVLPQPGAAPGAAAEFHAVRDPSGYRFGAVSGAGTYLG